MHQKQFGGGILKRSPRSLAAIWGLVLKGGMGGEEGKEGRGRDGAKGEVSNQTFWLRHCVP